MGRGRDNVLFEKKTGDISVSKVGRERCSVRVAHGEEKLAHGITQTAVVHAGKEAETPSESVGPVLQWDGAVDVVGDEPVAKPEFDGVIRGAEAGEEDDEWAHDRVEVILSFALAELARRGVVRVRCARHKVRKGDIEQVYCPLDGVSCAGGRADRR